MTDLEINLNRINVLIGFQDSGKSVVSDNLAINWFPGSAKEPMGCISMSARAKHFGRQFISENQRFTTEMLRPYEYICKNEMHPTDVTLTLPRERNWRQSLRICVPVSVVRAGGLCFCRSDFNRRIIYF
ncbi:hypothetical protein C7B67_21445 [filamentous cyanobacterium Phorm 6]|nr:hypothetical protein C7B67_21445 [filamentous cyanobacterium Phorm 6]